MAQLNNPNPNSHIRKAIFDIVNPVYPCFDYQVANDENLTQYVLFTSQSKNIEKANKCEYRWECMILLDIVTTYNGFGNPGSRKKVDDIETEIHELLKNIQITGYEVINRKFSFPDSLSLKTSTENIFRNFIRIELLLN